MPRVDISPESLSAIHEEIQKVKPPTGWEFFSYLVKDVLKGRVMPRFDLPVPISDSIDLDIVENFIFCTSFDLRLRDLVGEDFFNNNPLLPQFMRGTTQGRYDYKRQLFVDNDEVNKRNVFQSYANQTGLSVDIPRRHASPISRFGSVIATTMYQDEVHFPSVINVISSWQNTIMDSRATEGYIPFYEPLLLK